jgi:hypothetical protein
MQIKDIVEGLGDFLLWTFEILPLLGNLPNFLFIAIGAIFFAYWISQMVGHSRRGEN